MAALSETYGSLSSIVSTAVVWLPNAAPPPGFDSVRFTVWGPSATASSMSGTVKVLTVSPNPNVSRPATGR